MRTKKTTWVRAAPRYNRATASNIISPADRAASMAYPGSYRIITRKMAHYYHYYFIITDFIVTIRFDLLQMQHSYFVIKLDSVVERVV